MIWLDQNAEPGRVKRVTQALNGQVESVTIHEDYAARLKRWRQARDSWLADYVLTEHGLVPTPKIEATPVDKDADAEAYTNKLLDRVHGKELPEYQLGPAPPGRHWSLVEDEPVKKPRGGKRFSTIYQPRWGKK